MADASKQKNVAGKPKKPAPAFITSEQLDAKLEAFGGGLIDKVAEIVAANKPAPAAPVAETPLEKEVRKAAPNPVQTNPEWEEKAREILGESLDHTEYSYLKTGGVLFTVVITEEASNAPTEYMARMGQDRRSKEIGQEGTTGVEAWCKLVKQNLQKPR